MSYAVISEWVSKNSRQSTEGQAQEQAAKEKFAPGVMALGATAVYFIYTSDTTFNVVTIYPDEGFARHAAEPCLKTGQCPSPRIAPATSYFVFGYSQSCSSQVLVNH